MNWEALDEIYRNPLVKYLSLLFLSFFLLMSVAISLSSPNIDLLGHLGGLIYGFFLIWLVMTPFKENDGVCCSNKAWFWLCFITLIILYLVLALIFYLVIQIKEIRVANSTNGGYDKESDPNRIFMQINMHQ